MPTIIKQFLNTGMPILEHNLKYQTDDITNILKMMQSKKLFYYIDKILRKYFITTIYFIIHIKKFSEFLNQILQKFLDIFEYL
jgi:hypothetical protein